MSNQRTFVLGGVRLDPDRCLIVGSEGEVHLEPRVADLAATLVAHTGELATRDYLIDAVWQGHPGAEQSLTNAASKLRRAVEEAGGDPEVIETVPKRGYRLTRAPSSHAPKVFPGAGRLVWLAAASVLIVFVVAGFWQLGRDDGQQSIAVLAFEDLSPRGDQAHFSRGIAEEVLNRLSRINNLRVAGRTSAFSFADKDLTISEIGRRLEVSHVLEGSVRKMDERIRVTVQLIDSGSDRHVWSETYDADLSNVFEVQDRIASSVARQLSVQLEVDTAEHSRTDPRTHALLLRARHLFDHGDEEQAEQAWKLLEQGLERDPDHIPLLLLATREAYWNGNMEKVNRMLGRAVEIAPNHPQVMIFTAYGDWMMQYEPQKALDKIESALRRRPGNVHVLGAASQLLRWMGFVEEAIVVGERVVADDPLCKYCLKDLAIAHMYAGNLDEAERRIKRYHRLGDDGHLVHGDILLLAGKPGQALEQYELQQPPAGHPVLYETSRAMALHDLGRMDAYRNALEAFDAEWGEVSPSSVARIHAWAGDVESAIRALGDGSKVLKPRVPRSPFYDSLRGDPRWRKVLTRLGVSPQQRRELEFALPFD
ncbi:MAG: hypothetical protein GVY11_01880 [Gammaproteobacteria bacterium]|jgi:TolB-like protein/DNA-binding winged helix-turn-helix (wHTH) protein|nr:hypothetical protein [Gammaproteobacteria bacterium]